MVRGKARANDELVSARRRGKPQGAAAPCQQAAGAGGPYTDCLTGDERAALAQVAGSGLEQEMAVVRVLIRRAIVEGRPARDVAHLLNCLSHLLKTQHVISGKNAHRLDEALAAALDAIGAELGASL